MKTLILSGYGVKLGFRKGRFVIYKRGEKVHEVSPLELEQIIITTSGICITSRALRACARLGIDLVVLDHKGDVTARLMPTYVTQTVETRRLQYLAFIDKKAVEIAKWVVQSKLANQAEVLKYFSKSRRKSIEISSKLRDLAYEIEFKLLELSKINSEILTSDVREKILSIEAVAARAYWEGFRILIPEKLGFEKRDRESVDIVNLSLNYMYGLLRHVCTKAALLLNLDPYAGYLHVDRSGRPSLILDIMEIFRPIAVDKPLITFLSSNHDKINAIENCRLSPEYRVRLIQLFLNNLKQTVKLWSEKNTLESLIYKAVKHLKDYLHNKVKLKLFHISLC